MGYNGLVYRVIEVDGADRNKALTVWVGAEGQIARVQYAVAGPDGRPQKMEERFSDYRAVDGVQIPYPSELWQNGQRTHVPGVPAHNVVDPTGCGDAYRAGLLYGLANGMDWETTGRLASLIGAWKIAQRGGQNHKFTRDEIAARYKQSFNATLW